MPFVINPNERENYDVFCYYEGVFTPEECQKIIEMGQSKVPNVAHIADGQINTKIRKAKISWIEWENENSWLFHKLGELAKDANNTRYQFQISGFLEALQYTEYTKKGDHYTWHSDFGKGKIAMRKLSQVLLLSKPEEYTGGELEFQGLIDAKIPRTQGTLIQFPSFEYHRVTPLIKGNRKTLVTWLSGDPFR